MVRRRDINNTDPMLLNSKNYRDIKSSDVYQKVKSKEMCRLDYDSDEFLDVVKMARNNENYIYRVFNPLTVFIFSIEQLGIIKYLLDVNKGPLALYLDATGTVVHPPPPTTKRILYYAGVVHIADKKTVCPVFEMVTSEHDAYSIGGWLFAFESYVVKHKVKWPIFSTVVTDFSFALMNAIICVWMKMEDLSQYVNAMYENLENDKHHFKLHLKTCSNHLIKNMSDEFSKVFESKSRIKSWYMNAVASVFNKTSLESVDIWWECILIVCLSRFSNEYVKVCISNLREDEYNDSHLDSNFESNFNVDEETYKTLYGKSKFFLHFKAIFDNVWKSVENAICPSTEENIYYNPKVADILLKKYLPFLPLWSNIFS